MKIQTAFGEKNIDRRIGSCGEYYHEVSNPSAPNGAWWRADRQGFVPVASNSKALRAIIDADLRGSRVVMVLE